MAVLGTSVSDPNFYQHQGAAVGQALSSFIGAINQRRQQKDQAAQQEINSAFKLMAEYPELADGPYAQSLREKYAAEHPEVPGLLDVIAKRNQLAQQIPAAGADMMKGWTGLQSAYQADQQRLADLPDTTSVVMPLDTSTQSIFGGPGGPMAQPQPPLRSAAGFTPSADLGPYMSSGAPRAPLKAAQNVTLDLPNPEKLSLAKRLQATKPEMFPLTALQSMPPDKQLQASIWLKSQGYNLPDLSIVDQLKMLPEHVRAQRMVELGMVPPGLSADVVGYENKLAVPPTTKEELAHQDQAQAASKQNRLDEMHESDKLQRERMQLADSIRSAQQARGFAGQEDVIAYRSSVDGAGDSSDEESDSYDWKSIATDSKTAASDWDKRTSAATKGLTGKQREKANVDFITENGPRPTPIPTIIAKQIAAEIDSQGLTGSDANEAAIAASAAWQQARQGGAKLQDATKKALAFVNPENRIRIDFSSIKDEAKRRSAVADYAQRLQAGEPQGQAFKAALSAAQGSAGAPPAAPQAKPAPAAPTPPAPPRGPAGTAPAPQAAKPPAVSADDVRARVKSLYPKASPAQQEAIVARTLAKLQGGG